MMSIIGSFASNNYYSELTNMIWIGYFLDFWLFFDLLHVFQEASDDISYFVPDLIGQVVLPKLAGIIEFVWDPLSRKQVGQKKIVGIYKYR